MQKPQQKVYQILSDALSVVESDKPVTYLLRLSLSTWSDAEQNLGPSIKENDSKGKDCYSRLNMKLS